MILAAVTAVVYGGLVLAGGFMGFRKAGSKPSLIAGIVADTLLVLAALLMFFGQPAGAKLAMGVAALLLVFFGMRWLKGRKFMPAGLMVLCSAVALILLAWGGAL